MYSIHCLVWFYEYIHSIIIHNFHVDTASWLVQKLMEEIFEERTKIIGDKLKGFQLHAID